MIGIVIVTHDNFGPQILKTAEFILGRQDGCATVAIDVSHSPETMRQAVSDAIKSVDKGKGVIIFTDMFGGTPSNISLSFLMANKVEVVTGVNLPMILKALQIRAKSSTLNDAAGSISEAGRNSITVAGDILGKGPNC